MRSMPMKEKKGLEIYEDGRIVNTKTGKEFFQKLDPYGMVYINIDTKKYFVKSLVFYYFAGKRTVRGRVLSHIDGDQTNCHVDNLELRLKVREKNPDKPMFWMNGDAEIYL